MAKTRIYAKLMGKYILFFCPKVHSHCLLISPPGGKGGRGRGRGKGGRGMIRGAKGRNRGRGRGDMGNDDNGDMDNGVKLS